MPKCLAIAVTAFAIVAIWAADADAQLFGQRTLGTPLSIRPKPGSRADKAAVGTVGGAERFLRENRAAGEFVGTNAGDQTRFVGQVQANASEPVKLATEGLTPKADRSAQLNLSLARRRRIDMYEPKFVVGFAVTLPTADTVQTSLRDHLGELPLRDRYRDVVVTVSGDSARLTGTVGSEDDRQVLAALVLLEPGIAGVQNEVVVASPGSAPSSKLPTGPVFQPPLPPLPGR